MKVCFLKYNFAVAAALVGATVAFLLIPPVYCAEGGGTPGDGKESAPPQEGGPVQSNPSQDGVKPQDDPMHGDVPTKPDVDPDDKPPPAPPASPVNPLPPKEPGVPSIPE